MIRYISSEHRKCIWLVNDIVTTMSSDKVLCGSYGVYPSYAAGFLSSVKEIHFFVLSCETLNFADYFEKCIASKALTVTY